ncbi:MAG: DUF4160 domain-containing protein [Chitinophagales bacterium]|nr:DUF4160 domain-containing protein [Bacteroidota bacterium]MBX7142326.1 DUF4160 domain-containing protein [Chitinophagales bacterium]
MPKIYQYLSFIIRFYSNEHLPIHVHVQRHEREMKVEFSISEDRVTLFFKKIRGKEPLTETEANEVAVFLKKYHKEIIWKWEQFFIFRKKVSSETIRQKLRRKI